MESPQEQMAKDKTFFDVYSYAEDSTPQGAMDDPNRAAIRRRTKEVLAGLGRGIKILDAACGLGQDTRYLASLGHKAWGIDSSTKAIRIAQHHFPELPFIHAAIDTHLPFEDLFFDMVYSCLTIAHVLDTRKMFSEFNRVLVPGGHLVVITPYHGLLKNLVLAVYGFERHFQVDGESIRFYSRKSLRNILHANGFSVESMWRIGRIPPLAKALYTVACKA